MNFFLNVRFDRKIIEILKNVCFIRKFKSRFKFLVQFYQICQLRTPLLCSSTS